MKTFKFFSALAVAALLLAPTALMAKTSFHFSLNLIDTAARFLAPRPVIVAPPPVVVAPRAPVVYYTVPPMPVVPPQQRTVIKEIHHYYYVPQEPVYELPIPAAPSYSFPQHRR